MSAARLSSPIDADYVEVGEQRVGDRRRSDRRAPRVRLEPLFAATLINHVATKEVAVSTGGYGTVAQRLRAGGVVNVRA